MPQVTALRAARRRPERVLVELDGNPWRTLPADVVVRAGLGVGLELGRGHLRSLARELRRYRALEAAARSLARRDHTIAETRHRLKGQGFATDAREEAIEALAQAGVLDDGRFARARAESLAERGFGDAAIRAELERAGVAAELGSAALTGLEPEEARARRIALERGSGVKAARYLARRGFDSAAIEAAIPAIVAEEG